MFRRMHRVMMASACPSRRMPFEWIAKCSAFVVLVDCWLRIVPDVAFPVTAYS